MASSAAWIRAASPVTRATAAVIATTRDPTDPAATPTTRRTTQSSSARQDRENDEPPAPPARRPRRSRARPGPGSQLAPASPVAALGDEPARRQAARPGQPGDEPDVDPVGRPLLGRPGGPDVRPARAGLRHRVLALPGRPDAATRAVTTSKSRAASGTTRRAPRRASLRNDSAADRTIAR